MELNSHRNRHAEGYVNWVAEFTAIIVIGKTELHPAILVRDDSMGIRVSNGRYYNTLQALRDSSHHTMRCATEGSGRTQGEQEDK
jgi:hypothetical protein